VAKLSNGLKVDREGIAVELLCPLLCSKRVEVDDQGICQNGLVAIKISRQVH
jgi:hypothetical protein